MARDPNIIEFFCLEQEELLVEDHTGFQFRKDKKHHWLQRLAIWVLTELGCHYTEREIRHIKISILAPTLLKFIQQQMDIITYDFHKKPHVVYIGSEEFAQLTRQPEIHQYIRLNDKGEWVEVDVNTLYHFNEKRNKAVAERMRQLTELLPKIVWEAVDEPTTD